MMNRLLGYGVGCLITVAAGIGPSMADTVFTDDTFNLATYTPTTPFSTGPSGNIAASQCASCGDPGSGLQFVSTFNSSPAFTAVGETLINNLFSYNPQTQGVIASID